MNKKLANFWDKHSFFLVLGVLFGPVCAGFGFLGVIGNEGIVRALCGILIILGILWFIFFWVCRQADYTEYLKKHPYPNAEKFYRMCEEAGFTSIEEKANFERAKLIAQKCEISGSDDSIRSQFEIGKKYVSKDNEKINARKEEEKIASAHAEERKLLNQLSAYIYLTGREKRRQMLIDEIASLKKQQKDNEKMQRIGNDLLYKKEQDWAIAGGIASGIAGGAAGLAVASDIQRKNAEARAYNERIAPSAGLLMHQFYQKGSGIANWLKFDEEQLKTIDTKLGLEDSSDAAMSYLELSDATCEVSITGAVIVSVKVKAKEKFNIYENIPGVVDGTLSAELIRNGKSVGSAILTLPVMGVQYIDRNGRRQENVLTGICTTTTDPDAQYELLFQPYLLWLMER